MLKNIVKRTSIPRFNYLNKLNYLSHRKLEYQIENSLVKNIRITSDEDGDNLITIKWNDGLYSSYPAIYLRDNCIDGLTSNGHRIFETHQINKQQTIINNFCIDTENKSLYIEWKDNTTNKFTFNWLLQNSLNKQHQRKKSQISNSKLKLWDSQSHKLSVVCSYNGIEQNLIKIYQQLKEFGVALIDNVPTDISNYDPYRYTDQQVII